MKNICAIISARNAAQTIQATVQSFCNNGIFIYLLDNNSKDNTVKNTLNIGGELIKKVIKYPYEGCFDLERQLSLKEEITKDLQADWIIHADADEVFESPVNGESLRGLIERCDEWGYNVIDCDEFVFVPRHNEDKFEGRDFVAEMNHYYHFSPPNRTLHRIARKTGNIDGWRQSGGHRLFVDEFKIAPERARLRHYMGLSMDHLRAQYLTRVFSGRELARGWHNKRVATTMEFVRVPPRHRLLNVQVDGWRKDQPEHQHLVFDQSEPYKAPVLPPPDSRRKPMPFVVGVGRSGTTLLRLLLDAHPKLAITPETHWLNGLIGRLPGASADLDVVRAYLLSEPSWNDMHISDDQLNGILERHDPNRRFDTIRNIYDCYAERFGKTNVGDKTPLHSLSMTNIFAALPEARFIHILRDGRDVALSYRGLWFGPGKDIRDAAVFWAWRVRETRQQAQFLPHYMEVKYENLIRNTEAELRRICSFVGVDFHSDQLKFHKTAKQRLGELTDVRRESKLIPADQRRAIHELTSSPPDPSRIGRWKQELSRKEIDVFSSIAGGMLGDTGYELGFA